MYHVHLEVLLAEGYALFLVVVAAILEFAARHSHHRSERFRNSGFVYKRHLDVWECPTGHHLKREKTDFQRKIAHYRAPAHKCNACLLKGDCTDSNHGRLLESRMDGWLQSELSRFHRGISLTLLLLALFILLIEIMRYGESNDRIALAVLLLPIGLASSFRLASLMDRPTIAPIQKSPSKPEWLES